LLLPALIFCLFWLVVERRRAARVALLGLASLFIVGIFMTESRGGLIALAAAGLFACFVAGRWRTRAVLATALAVVVCVTYFGVIVGGTFGAASAGIRALARVGDVEMEVLARAVVLGSLGMLAAAFFFSGEYQKQLWLLLGASAALPSVANRMSQRVRKPAPV